MQSIVEVVAPGDRIEHSPDAAGLVRGRVWIRLEIRIRPSGRGGGGWFVGCHVAYGSPTPRMSAPPRSVFVPYNLRMVIRIASLLVLCLLTGCSYVNTTYQWMGGFATGMDVTSVSVDPVHVSTEYTTAVCAVDTTVEGALWLTDIPIADLVAGTVDSGQILHIELLWLPRPGYTPIDYEATNISIRYIVISGGEYGIYEGA